MEAASGFEPLHRGFADLSLNHLGTPPFFTSTIAFLAVSRQFQNVDNPGGNK
jgi:hypothetical protein